MNLELQYEWDGNGDEREGKKNELREITILTFSFTQK